MNLRQERDEWLMAQVALDQREHLEPLIRRYANPLLTFIRRMIGDAHRSEELFQEVFLSVWIKRGQYKFPRPFKSWLFAIALNKCRADFRRRPPPLALDTDDSAVAPADGGAAPPERVATTETAALVASAVTQLPPQQRTVLVLRVWDGLAYAEIAEIVGRTEATVRSNMHHALAAMRKILEPRLNLLG